MILMNSLLYSVFGFQLILSFIFSVNYIIWQNKNGEFTWYLTLYDTNFEKIIELVNTGDLFVKILTFLINFSHLVPISLYVALEIVKMIQSMLIFYDFKMIDPNTNNPANARTSDLIEELGQVEFVFSDKTGTLTKNEMEFKKCFINNRVFGENLNNLNHKGKYTINGDPNAYKILISNNQDLKEKILIQEFFTALAVCHSAFVEEKSGKKDFQVKFF